MPHPAARPAVGPTGLLVVILLPAVAGAQTTKISYSLPGPAMPSERSGAAGTERRLELSGPKGLKAIGWDERRDRPCHVEIYGRNLDNMGLDQTVEHDACGTPQAKPLVLGFADDNRTYLSGLRVCLNGDGDRVKGVQVRGRVLSAKGDLTDAPSQPRQERPNCKTWKRWVDCPGGAVASGLIAHYEAGDEPRAMTGMALLCSTVVAEQVTVFTPRLTGEARPLDAVSGSTGDPVDLYPGGAPDSGLDKIHWAERRDRPCTVTVEGRDLVDRNRRADRTVNRCGKRDVEETLNLTDAMMKRENANLFITGLRVCTTNHRVKGVEVEGKLPISAADPDPPKPVTETDKGWQVHCAMAQATGGYDGDWVRCPKGQVAVGLRAHFEKGEEPRAVRGMTLICRAYQ